VPFAVLLVPFFAFVAAFVLIGLSQTHTSQHGSGRIPNWLDISLSGVSLRDTLGLAKKASRSLVSHFAGAHLKMLTAFLHGMAHLWKQEFAAMRAEAQATAAVAGELERAIPREAHKAAAPAMARAKVANRHAEHALAQGRTTSRELHRFRARTHAQLRHDAHAIDVTIPNDIAGLRRRTRAVEDAQAKDRTAIGEIEHGAAETWDWIRTHPLSSVTGLFAGAIVVALSRLGYGFLRCRSWRNVGKRLNCGMGSSLLRLLDDGLPSLLGALLTYETVTHLDELVKLGQSVEHGVASGLQDLLNVKK
jgi:hypothetical protein